MIWQRYPLFRIFLALCIGILAVNFFVVSSEIIWILFSSASIGALLSHVWIKTYPNPLTHVFGVSVLLLFVAIGMFTSRYYLKQHHLEYLQEIEQEGTYRVQLTQSPINKGYAWRTEAKVIRVDSSSFETKALLYIQIKDSLDAFVPKYGDVYLFKGRFSILTAPKNPFEFDYKNYLNLRAVYTSAFVQQEKLRRVEQDSTSFMARAIVLRNRLLKTIETWSLPERQEQISKALLLGYRNEVDEDLLKAYSAVGAMHVLAVSGLHIGIVYLVLSKLLFFLKSRKQTYLKVILLVFMLWFYAVLTGLSPSVVRAATMFTFVALGTSFRRNTNIYNTLLASCMVLLCIKPTYLFEVGFQLSYVAVFGIVWIQPKMQNLWQPKFLPLKAVWGITTVSIAAQIATFPLGLYYFHQFPGLFLLSNLIVIPLVTVLMYSGLSLLLMSVIGVSVSWLVWCYSKLLALMNAGVNWVDGLHMWFFDQIHISRLEMVLFYTLILCFFYFLFSKKVVFLFVSLGLVISLQVFQLFENYELNSRQELTIYAVKNKTAYAVRVGSRLYFFADSSLQQDDAKLTFHIKHHWWASNVEEIHFLNPTENYADEYLLHSPQLITLKGIQLVKNPVSTISQAQIYWYTAKADEILSHLPERAIVLSTNDLTLEEGSEGQTELSLTKPVLHNLHRDGAFQYSW